MVILSQAASLPADKLTLFYATDPILSNASIVVLYGAATTSGSSSTTSSRIQTHVYTPAGFQSYPRLAVSPGCALYAAVTSLSREEQGDEVCRGLAFSLFKYFSELPEEVKHAWIQESLTTNRPSSALKLFSESHAADLASRMVKVEDAVQIIRDLETSLSQQSLSFLDADIILPPGSINQVDNRNPDLDEVDDDILRYGSYAPLIKLLGETMFFPTSKIRRAPSKPTGLNRSTTFSKAQKENMRREMCELVDTEESYVGKIYDLVHSVAADFREKARNKSSSSLSPGENALRGLFPPSLDRILDVNTRFLEAARNVVDSTENCAIADIESTRGGIVSQSSTEDPTGIIAFSRCLAEWFPQFDECYGEYIRAHGDFGGYLRSFMSETGSSFAKRVQETGEQRLMSMLIEPIQRLPRYSLYIDNVVKQLPIRHPALKTLLRAKDIISNTCTQDDAFAEQSTVLDRLRSLIPSWPKDDLPHGRFITAADVSEILAPYDPKQQIAENQTYIAMLFSDSFVLIQRSTSTCMSARGLTSEIESPNISLNAPSSTVLHGRELIFHGQFALSDIEFTETGDGELVRLLPFTFASTQGRPLSGQVSGSPSIRTFCFGGIYSGKASRWVKDFLKARTEGRFGETERESSKWEARCADNGGCQLDLMTAIYEESPDPNTISQGKPAPVRITIDSENDTRPPALFTKRSEIAVSVLLAGNGFYRIEADTFNESRTRDMVTKDEFLPVLTKRIGNVVQMKSQIRNPALTTLLLQQNQAILKSLNLPNEKINRSPSRSKSFRPPSPVKALASLFSGGSFKESVKAAPAPPSLFSGVPRMPPPMRTKSENEVNARRTEDSKIAIVGDRSQELSTNPLRSLEDTLASYVLALHARKGNVIGRVVASRGQANEATVNELYNSLLEEPTGHEGAAQVSVDVLFASFEKFLNHAWKESMGPVLSTATLVDMQRQSETLSPLDYEEYLAKTIGDLSPQNQRALKAIIGLLADLLEGTSNDGDRGALTAAITEIVVCDINAHEFMPLFDRLVDDQDVLNGDGRSDRATPNFGSTNSKHSHSPSKSGSLSSKASSLTKRFGWGSLHREGSRDESTPKSGSIFRTWSKAKGDSGRPQLEHQRSTDLIFQSATSSRPTSREQLSTANTTPYDSRPNSSKSDKPELLPTLPEKSLPSTPRKKRRSSLSDLPQLPTPSMSPFWETPREPESVTKDRQLPPHPALGPTAGSSVTPTRANSVQTASPTKKENLVPSLQRYATVQERQSPAAIERSRNSPSPSPTKLMGARQPPPPLFSPSRSPSVVPVPKGVLSERPASGNTPPPPLSPTRSPERSLPNSQEIKTPLTGSPKKLKMASPQKLRQRLQDQQAAIDNAESSLQSELDKIGQELSGDAPRPDLNSANLNTRLKAVETKLPHMMSTLKLHNENLERDSVAALQASERKNKELTTALKNADLENEALYKRMNSELEKIFSGVQEGAEVEELRRKMIDAQEEAAKLKKENARLKRENIALRAQVGVEKS